MGLGYAHAFPQLGLLPAVELAKSTFVHVLCFVPDQERPLLQNYDIYTNLQHVIVTGVCNNYGLNHLYWVTFYFCLFTFREDGRILRMMVHTYPHVYLLSELQCSQASKL